MFYRWRNVYIFSSCENILKTNKKTEDQDGKETQALESLIFPNKMNELKTF